MGLRVAVRAGEPQSRYAASVGRHSMSKADLIPLASLLIAALAVFMGPLLSWQMSRRTLAESGHISRKQMLLPIRQTWLSELRKKLADVLALSLHYWAAGFEDRTDEEYRELTVIQQEVKLLLDPHDPSHEELVGAIRNAVEAIQGRGPEGHDRFAEAHTRLEKLSRELVHHEWQRLIELDVVEAKGASAA